MRILVVDDDPKLRRFVERGLEECGHSCALAADAEAALASLAAEGAGGFDAILLDVVFFFESWLDEQVTPHRRPPNPH